MGAWRLDAALGAEPAATARCMALEMRIRAALIAVALVTGCGREPLPDAVGTSQAGGPGAVPSPTLAPDWQLVTAHDLVIPIPPGWKKTLDAPGNSDRPDPDAPWILYFADPSAAPATARIVSIWIWPSASVDQLIRERYVQGNLSLVSERTVVSPRPMREVVGVASWSDSGASGRYRGRHLFVQADPQRVVDVVVFGPRTPSSETEPTMEMRSIQETVIAHVVARPSPESASCPRTRGLDASGVITSNGTIGIVRDTYVSSADVNGSFLMVRRGSTIGQRAEVDFHQVGSSAPASRVFYGVAAELWRTPPAGWGDIVFKLGVKPIGFTNSCWGLFVDGTDTGIVLFVGP